MKSKANKGITLISLVITIIILLILAGVSITAVFGENEIISGAQEAKEKTDEVIKSEISIIGELEDTLYETQTGIVVEKVTDENPGKLEQDETEQNTYTINSIEDLVVFAHNVTTGIDNYEGKTVKLGLSLDFASTKSYVNANRTDYGDYGYNGQLKKLLNESGFIPIGTPYKIPQDEDVNKYSFCGTFDGNKNSIYNLRMSKTVKNENEGRNIGIFTVNNGNIQDLNIENANIYIDIEDTSNWKFVGILAATNSLTGKINRCHISGKISGTIVAKCDVGGIVGATQSGEVCNSYSEVDIKILGEDDINWVYKGLIAGSCNEEGTIKNVYSKGNIYTSNRGFIGLAVGGCNGKIINSYTIGKIKVEINGKKHLSLGTICGWLNESGRISNCYYLENGIEIIGDGDPINVQYYGIKEIEEDMKKPSFITLLNNGQEGNPWKQDTNNINDGYPILSWQ